MTEMVLFPSVYSSIDRYWANAHNAQSTHLYKYLGVFFPDNKNEWRNTWTKLNKFFVVWTSSDNKIEHKHTEKGMSDKS